MRRKAQFKSNCTDEVMPGFLAINNEHLVAYAPINGFTRANLGCERGGNMFSMIQQLDAPESKTYLQLFDQLWADKRRMQDVTEQRKRKIDFTKIERYRENNRIEAKKVIGGRPKAYGKPTTPFPTHGGIILLTVEEVPDKSHRTIDLLDLDRLIKESWDIVNDPVKTSVNILFAKDVFV